MWQIFKSRISFILNSCSRLLGPLFKTLSDVRWSRLAFCILILSIIGLTADVFAGTLRAMFSVFSSLVRAGGLASADGGVLSSGFLQFASRLLATMPWIVRKVMWIFGFDWLLWGLLTYLLMQLQGSVMWRVGKVASAVLSKTADLV